MEPEALQAKSNKRATRPVQQQKATARQIMFAQAVVSGCSQAEAYRRVYNPKANIRRAAEKSCRMAALPLVAAEIARLRARKEMKVLLTVNDRLAIMAQGAQSPDATWQEKARCIAVYSSLAGDLAPERKEVSGPNGGPIQVNTAGPTAAEIAALPLMDRIALFDQGRAAELAQLPAGRN